MKKILTGGIICPLLPSWEDGLLTLTLRRGDKKYRLIADTGSGERILFSRNAAANGDTVFGFQQMNIGIVDPHDHTSPAGLLECSENVSLDDELIGSVDENNDITDVADGILGLGPFKLGGSFVPFLFSPSSPQWSSISISIPSSPKDGAGKLTFFNHPSLVQPPINFIPVVSDYYWAVAVEHISTLDIVQPIVAIIDSGSNIIGLSGGIYERVRDHVQNNLCKTKSDLEIEFQGSGGNSFAIHIRPDQYLLGNSCDDLAISRIDSSRFGDVSNKQVVILGTRSLAGMNVGIHRSGLGSENAGVPFYVSLN